jgi:hypothetical protein
MKIIIQNQGVMRADVDAAIKKDSFVSPEVAFDSSAFDVPGWVSIEIGGVCVAEVHAKDLAHAAQAFLQEYKDSE